MKSLVLLPNRLMHEAGVEYEGDRALCGAELELYNLGVHNAGGGSGIPSNSATQATHANPIENRRPDQSVPQKCAEMGPSRRGTHRRSDSVMPAVFCGSITYWLAYRLRR